MKRHLFLTGLAVAVFAVAGCAKPAEPAVAASASPSTSVASSASVTTTAVQSTGPVDLAARTSACEGLHDAKKSVFLQLYISAVTLRTANSTPDEVIQAGRDLVTNLTALGASLTLASATTDGPLKAATGGYASEVTTAIAGIQSAGADAAKIQAVVLSATAAEQQVNALCLEAGVDISEIN